MSVSFHRLSCQQLSSQTTMSLHLQRWRRLHQTWVLKKYRQTHRMCSLLVRLFVNWQLFTSIIRYRTKSNLIFSFQIFCSRRSLKATQSNLKSVVNQGQLAFALQEVVKLVKHIPSRPRHTFHHNSYRKKLQIGDEKNAKKTGGEIFETPLPAVNVSVSAVKVFIVVLIICYHSDNFMIRNETLVWYMLLLHPFHYYRLFDAYKCY